jgi:eukaryotic-like serine/threonine-protein kinase
MSITPDGKRLVYGGGRVSDSQPARPDAERRSVPLTVTKFSETDAEISPDGRWLAYRSNGSGRDEVYVRPFRADDQRRWLISTTGGTEPLWSPDGRELFYRTEAEVMGVPVETSSGFRAGTPSVVLAGPYIPGGGRSYDISRDGKRFLMIKAAETDPDSGPVRLRQIVVVQHWFEDLKARVPTK